MKLNQTKIKDKFKRLRKNKLFLKALHNKFKKVKSRKAVVKKFKPTQIVCIAEICKNVLAGTLKLTDKCLQILRKYKEIIRYLASKQTNVFAKRKKLLTIDASFLITLIACVIPLVSAMPDK